MGDHEPARGHRATEQDLPGPVSSIDRSIEQRLDFARTAVRAVRPIALRYFRSALEVVNKAQSGPMDPVTAADREIEAALREALAKSWPDDGVHGEEQGHQPGTSGITWVIDPIDGTRAFMTGMVHWGVLVAIDDGLGPVAGVLYQPYMDELFVGCRGVASYLQHADENRQLRTRVCKDIGDVVLGTTGPQFFAGSLECAVRDAVLERVRLYRFGGDCYLYAMLAAGQFDVVLEAGLNPWDIQALVPIVEGAGGRVTTWDGGNPRDGGRILACGDPSLHADLLAFVQSIQ